VVRAVVARLNAEFVKALNDPAVTKPLLDQSLDILPGSPDELSQVLSRDLARYGTLIKEIGAKVE
jgi:tripartite-type tricarboxylate transporter receptor subunit TctC